MCVTFLEYTENGRQKLIPRTNPGRVMRMDTGDHRPDGFTVGLLRCAMICNGSTGVPSRIGLRRAQRIIDNRDREHRVTKQKRTDR